LSATPGFDPRAVQPVASRYPAHNNKNRKSNDDDDDDDDDDDNGNETELCWPDRMKWGRRRRRIRDDGGGKEVEEKTGRG
jgi:hypothetical protein